MRFVKSHLAFASFALWTSGQALSLNLDGSGHYAVRGETLVAPAASEARGLYQAIEHSARLNAEARFNDRSSFIMELGFLPSESHLGDDFTSKACEAGQDDECYPNTQEPSYKPYQPSISKAYISYGFDYFILETGRRGRDWGLGIFLDSGKGPFAKQASIYDGISLDINLQKTQSLGFKIGYDKIAETGATIGEGVTANNGPSNKFDDVDQIFFAIEYDDQKGKNSSQLKKKVGIYAAKAYTSEEVEKGGAKTDLNNLDIYLDLNYQALALRNEALLTHGKTADPNTIYLGGAKKDKDEEPAVNHVSSIALASELDWILSHSGGVLGPIAYKRGDLIRHMMRFGFAYAPGDSDGYYSDRREFEASDPADAKNKALSIRNREQTARGMAFHKNYKPALILFNGKKDAYDLNIDGIFDNQRLMNTQLFYLGYRYENMQSGDIELRLLTASLIETMPKAVKDYYNSLPDDAKKPVGYYGRSLGWELDATYTKAIETDVELGLGAGILLPGKAWQVSSRQAKLSYTVQSSLTFQF